MGNSQKQFLKAQFFGQRYDNRLCKMDKNESILLGLLRLSQNEFYFPREIDFISF